MECASGHPSGAQKFAVAPTFLENLYAPWLIVGNLSRDTAKVGMKAMSRDFFSEL
jgi:hypothetical protein